MVFKNFWIKKFNNCCVFFQFTRALSIKSAQTASTQPWWNSSWVTRVINNKCRCFPNFYCLRWLQFFSHKYFKATEKYFVFETTFSGALRINRSLHSLAQLLSWNPCSSLPYFDKLILDTLIQYYLYQWLKRNIQTRYFGKSMTFGYFLQHWIDIQISCEHYGVPSSPLFSSPLLFTPWLLFPAFNLLFSHLFSSPPALPSSAVYTLSSTVSTAWLHPGAVHSWWMIKNCRSSLVKIHHTSLLMIICAHAAEKHTNHSFWSASHCGTTACVK